MTFKSSKQQQQQQQQQQQHELSDSFRSAGRAPLLDADMPHSHVDLQKQKNHSILLNVTSYIVVCEFCERLAYYGLAGSLVLFLQTNLHMSNAAADIQYALWSGACYVTPLLGGWIADAYLGRYKAILLFSCIYLCGLLLTTFGAMPSSSSSISSPAPLVLTGIYIIAIGTGGIKPNVSTFGADQFDDSKPQDVKEKASYFNWFYFSINLGALISYTLVSYICQYGVKGLGGERWGFSVGFAIPCIAMACAVITFIAGSSKYKLQPATGSTVGKSASIIWQALTSTIAYKRNNHAQQHHHDIHNQQRHTALNQYDSDGSEYNYANSNKIIHWIDRARVSNGGSYWDNDVDAVKCVWRLLPMLAMQIPYWAVYSQMSTAFQNQGCQMDLSLGTVNIPVSALNMFDTLAILLLIPVFDRIIYPMAHRLSSIRSNSKSDSSHINSKTRLLAKVGCGFIFALLAVATAGLIEIKRKDLVQYDIAPISHCQHLRDYDPNQFVIYHDNGRIADKPSHCRQIKGCNEMTEDNKLSLTCIYCDEIPLASSMNVLWQIPQFMLIGTSEILAAVTAMEFFYSEAPVGMRSMSSALNLLCTALGSWLTIPLIKLVNINSNPRKQWVPDDLNQGHLEKYFFLLAGLMAFTLCFFVWWAKDFHYKRGIEQPQPISASYSHDSMDVQLQ